MLSRAILTLWIMATLFTKASYFDRNGEDWWKAFIPFYNVYVMMGMTNTTRVMIPLFTAQGISVISLFTAVRYMAANATVSNVSLIISLIAFVGYSVLYFIVLFGVCDKEGIKKPFSAGLYLVPPVFFGILAFRRTAYVK